MSPSSKLSPTASAFPGAVNIGTSTMAENSEDSALLASNLVPYTCEILLDEDNYVRKHLNFRKHMQTVKSGYIFRDPRTWPRITPGRFDYLLRPEQTSRDTETYTQIPIGVAYDQDCLDELRLKSGISLRGGVSWWWGLFSYYPFNFDRNGKQRDTPHLPKADFVYWMAMFNGPDWQKNFPAVGEEKMTATEQPSEPATTYERIMKFLKEQKAASPELNEVHEELRAIRANAAQETKRANKAQSDLEKEQDLTKTLQQQVRTTRLQKSETELHLRKANQTIEEQKQEHDNAIRSKDSVIVARDARISEQDAEIAKLRAEVKDANDKIEEIWKEMSSIPQNALKRAMDEEERSKQPNKKTKTRDS